MRWAVKPRVEIKYRDVWRFALCPITVRREDGLEERRWLEWVHVRKQRWIDGLGMPHWENIAFLN